MCNKNIESIFFRLGILALFIILFLHCASKSLENEKEEKKILEEVGKEEKKNSDISDLKKYDPHNSVKEEHHACLLSQPMIPSQRDDEFKKQIIDVQTFVQRLVVGESPPHKVYDISVNCVKQ